MAQHQQGTGRHPHKDSKDPQSHAKDQGTRQAGGRKGDAGSDNRDDRREAQAGPDDLKAREYRDEKGQVHHHTRSYMERHDKEEGGSDGGAKRH